MYDSYTCGEHSIRYKLVKSLCCITEIVNVTLCDHYTQPPPQKKLPDIKQEKPAWKINQPKMYQAEVCT